MTKDYEIPKHQMSILTAQIKKLNKRAAKIGCAPITIEVISERTETITHTHSNISGLPSFEKVCVYTKVRIKGETPKYKGWNFAATIQHLPAVGKTKAFDIVRSLPDVEIPKYFRNQQNCDYCGHNRYRKDTFVIQHEDGTWKQVGRQCLRDFLGHQSPHALAEQAQLITDALDLMENAEKGEDCFKNFREPQYFSLKFYLEWVAGVIRVCGWVSRSNAQQTGLCATTNLVESLLSPLPIKDPKYRAEMLELYEAATPTEKDKKKVAEAIEWALNLETNNDYLYNINTIAKSGVVTEKLKGYAASIIPAYQRIQEQQQKIQEQQKSKHFGTVGKRETFTLTVDKLIPLEGRYGTTTLHLFHDEQGNRAIWFASAEIKLQVGNTVNCKATVKDHNEREGIKQTVLNRVRVSL